MRLEDLRLRLRTSLRNRVYLLLALGVGGPLLVVVMAFGWRLATLDEQLLASRQYAASAAAAQVAEELNERLEGLQRAASAPRVAPGGSRPEPERAALRRLEVEPRVLLAAPVAPQHQEAAVGGDGLERGAALSAGARR